jgi:hypothetical protein
VRFGKPVVHAALARVHAVDRKDAAVRSYVKCRRVVIVLFEVWV